MHHGFTPTVAETIEAHRLLIEEFGGSTVFRDKGCWSRHSPSAKWLLRQSYRRSIWLMESLANNHAFIDGNKRASFVMTDHAPSQRLFLT